MEASEIRNLNVTELEKQEKQLRRQLYDLRCQAVTEKLENPRQLRDLRRDIARVLTVKRQQQLKENAGR